MVTRRLCVAVLAPVFALVSCAPGRGGGGGIGCSTTSSVLKAPQIRTGSEMSAPSESTHRKRVVKLFGSEGIAPDSVAPNFMRSSVGGLNTSGGYIYITSRTEGDPLGLKRSQNGKIEGSVRRCGVLVEYPKNTGEVVPPGESGGTAFPSSNADAYRFPADSDELKLRLYTAAHCLDYSLNESIVLRLFKGHTEVSAPSTDYLDVPLHVPEIAAVKTLRKEVKKKIDENVINTEQGVQILNAFRPANVDLVASFGTTGKQGKCAEKPSSISDSTEQYSCATYHDMAVLDVTLADGVSQDIINQVKNRRADWVTNIKAEEAKGPWSEYVKPLPTAETSFGYNLRLFVDFVLESEQADTAKSSQPTTCKAFPSYGTDAFGNACSTATGDPNCLSLTTKLGLFLPSPANCLQVAINSPNTLAYVRHITRERLRTFSRFNMTAQAPKLADSGLDFDACIDSAGICALKDAVNDTLQSLLNDADLSTATVATKLALHHQRASERVDASLNIWKPFLNAVQSTGKISTLSASDDPESGPSLYGSKNILQEIINPIDFLKLHSNFLIKEDNGDSALPDATDDTTARLFMSAPMPAIVGMDSYFDKPTSGPNVFKSSINDSEGSLPIEILPWSGSGPQGEGIGKFLKLFVTKDVLDTFFSHVLAEYPDNSGISTPPANIVWMTDENGTALAPLPTKVYLQKGDSGSIFTLDTVPMFALSMVNGEATSGGAQLAARSQEFEDTDDVMPVGPGDGGGGGGGPSVVANTCK